MTSNTNIENKVNNLASARGLADGYQSCTLHGENTNLTKQLMEQLPTAPKPLSADFTNATTTEQDMLALVKNTPEVGLS